jgi:hypothetical protein
MKSFNAAFTEFIAVQFIPNTKPHLVWLRDHYVVTRWYDRGTIEYMGGEVIL